MAKESNRELKKQLAEEGDTVCVNAAVAVVEAE